MISKAISSLVVLVFGLDGLLILATLVAHAANPDRWSVANPKYLLVAAIICFLFALAVILIARGRRTAPGPLRQFTILRWLLLVPVTGGVILGTILLAGLFKFLVTGDASAPGRGPLALFGVGAIFLATSAGVLVAPRGRVGVALSFLVASLAIGAYEGYSLVGGQQQIRLCSPGNTLEVLSIVGGTLLTFVVTPWPTGAPSDREGGARPRASASVCRLAGIVVLLPVAGAVAIGAFTCVRATRLTVRNSSLETLADITVAGRGFHHHWESLGPGQSATADIWPARESHLSVSFRVGQEERKIAEAAYFRKGDEVTVEVRETLRLIVHVRSK